MEKYSVKRAAALLMVVTLFGKLLGFGREMVVASQFGATYLTDSYIAGYLIPNFIGVLLNAGLVNVYAPVFLSEREIDEDGSWDKINSVSTYIMVILLILSVLGIIISPYIVKLLYSGFDDSQIQTTVSISRLFFIGMFVYGIGIIEGSILNSFRHFVYPALSIGLLSLGIIVLVPAFGGGSNINSIAYGYLLGAGAGLIIQHIKLKKIGGRFKFNFKLYSGFNKRFLALLFPVLVATSMSQANVFVDRIFASYLPDGSMSYLAYADKVTELPIFVFSGIISTVIFPDLIQYINEKDNEKLKVYFNKAIVVSLLFLIPSLVGLAVLRKEIISFLFERNAFDSAAVSNTASALIYYSPIIVLYGVMAIISKVYYSMKDTSTLMYISIGTIALNAVLDYVLMKPMLHNGLALATSIVAVIQIAAAYYLLRRKIDISMGTYLFRNLLKIIIASLFMGIILCIIKGYLGILSSAASVLLAVFTGAVIYFLLLLILRVDEMEFMMKYFKRKKRGI